LPIADFQFSIEKKQMNERNTRPSAIPAEYDRSPAPLPNAPLGENDIWLARLVSGIEAAHNMYFPYTYPIDEDGYLRGVYLTEINPRTFEVFKPSRTFDDAWNHNGTFGVNLFTVYGAGGYAQWPCLGAAGIYTYVWVTTKTVGGSSYHYFNISPALCAVQVTEVSNGWVTKGKWPFTELSNDFFVKTPSLPPSGYYAWPYAVVGDIILAKFGAGFAEGALTTSTSVVDATPRIPIRYSNTKPGSQSSHVQVDPAIPGLWVVDVDT